jgi:hypothetical protein
MLYVLLMGLALTGELLRKKVRLADGFEGDELQLARNVSPGS